MRPSPGTTAFTDGNTFDNLVNGTAPLVQQTLASLGKISPTALNFGALNPGPIDTGLRNPQVQQWNFGIEREIRRDLVLKASYVGNQGQLSAAHAVRESGAGHRARRQPGR